MIDDQATPLYDSVSGVDQVPTTVDRHTLVVRLCHWINAAAFLCLVVSGIGILVAHPQFYWGQAGYFGMEPWLKLWFEPDFSQTDWGRNIHFLFAWVFVINGLIYLVSGLLGHHFLHNLLPSREQLKPKNILADIGNHMRLHTPTGEEARHYNFLQKIAYLVVIVVLCPLMLLTGLTMSPGIIAAFPELLDIFGGRQSARTMHFLCASSLVLFLLIHLAEIFIVGACNEIRAMITGRYQLPREKK